MRMLEKHSSKILAAAALLFAATIVLAGAMGWAAYGRAPGNMSGANRPSLPPGTPNPADSLERVSAIVLMDGKVMEVGTNTIVIARADTGARLAVAVDSGTELFKAGAEKDPAAYKKEIQEFNEKLAYADDFASTYIAPDSFVHVPVTLADLRPGDLVIVATEKDEGSSVHAIKIQLTKSAGAAAQ